MEVDCAPNGERGERGWIVRPSIYPRSGVAIAQRLLAEQMLDYHLVERLVVAVGDELGGGFLVEGANFLHEELERASAVEQMIHPMLRLRRAEGMHIEADVFAVLPVAVAFERADLIERTPDAHVAERAVLIILQSVLVVEMQRPELAELHGEIDFIRRIEPGESGVRGFNQASDALRVAREPGDD